MATTQDGWLPATEVETFDPARFDFEWNADYTAFRPHRLLWWDDASYRAYQADDTFAEEPMGAVGVPLFPDPVLDTDVDDCPF